MFEYTFPTTGELHIATPKVNNFSEVKILENSITAESAHTVCQYPNGVIFETTLFADKAIIRCSHELIDNHDGTYTVS